MKIYGKAGEADADIAAIPRNFHVKLEFPEEVLAAAEAVPDEIPQEELAQRVFYEHPVTFTIDPEDAKDHDDAVALRVEPDGRYTLLVHIAESRTMSRGQPHRPRSPERRPACIARQSLSDAAAEAQQQHCSLKEGKLRLTKTVSMTLAKT